MGVASRTVWPAGNRGRFPAAAAGALIGAVVWEVAGRSLQLPFLPPLSEAVLASSRLIGMTEVRRHLAESLVSLTLGYLLAASLGLVLGSLMGRFRRVGYFFDLYLQVFLASPSLIYVPVLFALFGVGRSLQMAVVFLYAFFVIVSNTMAGVRAGDGGLIEMSRSFGASQGQVFWMVTLPSALPLILAGLRLGMARAMKGMVNGEIFVALTGLGALIRTYGGRFDAANMFGVLLLILAVAVTGVGLVQVVERRLTGWAD